ncbi:helix-turn-helix domain-containing protein, partial [Frankia sp. Cr1]|uniref:helix-turn-helix domain-containing protein n=1 Tax=Frankia sp. Cr1 TaxID=3073931 RepID=UPI002AD40892
MPQPRQPLVIPDNLWDQPRARAVCAARDVGRIFLLVRTATGASQSEVAERTGLTQPDVSAIEHGRRAVTTLTVLERIFRGLGIPLDRLTPTTAPATVVDSHPGPGWGPAHIVEGLEQLTVRDLMLGRRDMLTDTAMLTGAALVTPLRRWLSQNPTPLPHRSGRSIGPDDIDSLATTATAFRNWDVQFGGGLRRKAVVGQLNEVVDLLHSTHPPDVHTELYRVTADLAETAGNVLWDSGQRGRAQHYFTLGIKAASQAGDRPLAAHILATMAVQAVESGDLHGGLDLIQLAQHGIRRTPMPRMTAMLATREGWIYAQLGRVQDCHRAIGYAEEAFADTRDGDAPT